MKYFLCLIALISFSAFSQDVIIKKNGEKIEAKVTEITSTTIKYKAHNQPEGPLRNIAISEVEEIIYEDGTWEKFDKPRAETETEEEGEPSRPMPTRPDPRKNQDPILQSGFFLEGIIGPTIRHSTNVEEIGFWDANGNYVPQYVTTKTNDIYASINFRIGTKWYFGAGEKWRPGLQVNFFRFGLLINNDPLESVFLGPKNFTICNVGMSNALKFNENIGMELNANGGYNLELYPDEGTLAHGIAANAEVKFRYRRFGVGIDYTHIFGISVDPGFGGTYSPNDRPASYETIGVSVGVKF